MKIFKLITGFLLLLILLISCNKDSICPEEIQYHLFTNDELKLIDVNIDSAIAFQNRIMTTKPLYDQYLDMDTVFFLNENSDSITIFCFNAIRIESNHICSNDKPMLLYSSVNTYSPCFFERIEYSIEKTTSSSKPLIKSFKFEFSDGSSYSQEFSINDTVAFNYSYINNVYHHNGRTKVVVFEDSISLNSVLYTDCFHFKLINEEYDPFIDVYFSKKYGFIKFKNNTGNEILK